VEILQVFTKVFTVFSLGFIGMVWQLSSWFIISAVLGLQFNYDNVSCLPPNSVVWVL